MISKSVRILAAGITAALTTWVAAAAAQSTVDVGLLGPFSGPWAEHGKLMRIGADMAVEEINRQGGIKALGGAKINLVVADTGPSVETATNAAQRLLSGRKLSAFLCCFLSSFTLAASEIGERLQVPMLTFSYSDVSTPSATAAAPISRCARPPNCSSGKRRSSARPSTAPRLSATTPPPRLPISRASARCCRKAT